MTRVEYCRDRCRHQLHSHLIFFFFNDPATTEIYTLSLQRRSSDLEPVGRDQRLGRLRLGAPQHRLQTGHQLRWAERLGDRKSTRLNSSHLGISYAVFCLKKKHEQIAAHGSPHHQDATNATEMLDDN